MMPDAMAVGRGSGGGRGFGSVHGGHGFGYGRGHGSGRYGRGYGYGYGLYWDEYDNGASDAVGDITSVTPVLDEIGARPPRAPIICKETVTVPSEDGGTRQIKMIRC